MELLRSFGITHGSVAAFMAFGHEPPTDVLVSSMNDLGWTVLLPKVVSDTELAWVPYDGMWDDDLLGIATPSGQEQHELASVRAVFIPAVAASSDGARLGRGKGYYDRALARVPRFARSR